MSWRDKLPAVRGPVTFDTPLAPYTWLRVGGPAEVLFLPKDADDLAEFLSALDPGVPVLPVGVGSNLLVRDGGVDGVVIRLGPAFARISIDGVRVSAGAAALDSRVAADAARAGVAGLEFLRGVPGTIGGALAMNAGCYGSETADVVVEADAVTRDGRRVTLGHEALGFSYRTCKAAAAGDLIFTLARMQGRADAPEAVEARLAEITARREASQPLRERTGGSTFKNPPGDSAWRLVDAAGWRGRAVDGARFSELHANFMINDGSATAEGLEALGERARADVRARFGVDLEWEIRRVGRPR